VPCILSLELDGGEWPASRPGRFIPGEGTPGTIKQGAGCDKTSLNAVAKRKIPSFCQESNPFHPVCSENKPKLRLSSILKFC